MNRQIKITAIPKRITQSMREVWLLQSRLRQCTGIKPFRLLAHPRFRAAYDFLVLRAETGGADTNLAQWWTEFQTADEARQKKMTRPAASRKRSPKKFSASKAKPKNTDKQ